MSDFRSVSTRTRVGRFDAIFPAARGDDFNARFARLGVLYEDLSIEVAGITALKQSFPAMEKLGYQYRQQYFARRAIGTLLEFAEAIRALGRTAQFSELIAALDSEQIQVWKDASDFFDVNEPVVRRIRNDVGGHFGEAASRHAVRHIDRESTAAFTLEYDINRGMRVTFGFAGEIAATALLRHAKGENTEDQARFVFALLAEGLKHAMLIVVAVFGLDMWNKLGR
jgi:hypothetical protein